MSAELYETFSLAARYLFALLGVLIVLRALLWLLSDRAERRRRVRNLPWAGFIGEFVVVSGDTVLPEGMTISVPWEGTLGSVRSCDVYLPCAHVRRNHLSFSFDPGTGLQVLPFSGCEAMVNGVAVDCKSRPEDCILTHGSFLQAGNALLRLRVLAGLDPGAGFRDLPQPLPQPQVVMSHQNLPQPELQMPPQILAQQNKISQQEMMFSEVGISYASPNGNQGNIPDSVLGSSPEMNPVPGAMPLPVSAGSPPADLAENSPDSPAVSARRRRSDRWEVDWSE